MTKRTRHFLLIGAGILVIGLGTGLVASYMGGLQGVVGFGTDGPPELAYVPSDARAVAFANVRDVMDSELRQKLMQFQPGGSGDGLGDGANQFQQETGIDIQRDVDRVVVALSAADAGVENSRPLLLARGYFDATRIEILIRERGGVVESYKDQRLLTHTEAGLAVAFVEPGLAAIGSPAGVRRAIDTKASGDSVTGNADLMRLVRDIDDGNAWSVAQFDALTGAQQLPADLARQLPAITWVAASGYINGGLRGVVRAETRDEVAAQDLRQVIQGFVALARMQTGQRAELAGLMNSIELGGTGNTVSLGFQVPPEMIDALGAMHAQRPQSRDRDPGVTPPPALSPSPAL
jgi:hypothetical protein